MQQDTSIQRGYNLPQDHFTIVPNAWIRDTRLSRRARGLLVELMSHKPGWKTSVASLVRSGTEGAASVKSTLRELKDIGYLELEWTRDERGRRTGSTYTITDPAQRETPSSDPQVENRPVDEPQDVHEGDFRPVDNPPVDNPSVANPSTKKNTLQEDQSHLEDQGGENAACRVLDEPHQRAHADEQRRRPIDELESKIREAGLSARFDKLTPTQIAAVEAEIAANGVTELVACARRLHRADDPARFASAWIDAWSALPRPREDSTTPSRPECSCAFGWIGEDELGQAIPCPACRPHGVQRTAC